MLEKSQGAPPRGRRFSAGEVSIDLNTGDPFDVFYLADTDTITLHLGPMSYDVSMDTDKAHAVVATSGQLGFAPNGAEVKSHRTQAGAEFVNIRAPSHLWETIEQSSGKPRDKHALLGMGSENAHRIAQMGRDFVLNGNPGGRLVAESLACLALTEVQRLCEAPLAERSSTKLTPNALRRVMDYVEANLGGDLSLFELAGVACLSAAHFSRAFSATVGRSPSRYVAQRRVDRARTLLETVDYPLAEIAYCCGFSSQSHFTTCFRALVGATPAAYRKAHHS
ncbi:MAG: AraC family transcriptional regulator [Pseudomonadota bacterium]